MKAASRFPKSLFALVFALALLPLLSFAQGPKEPNHYIQTNLVANRIDPSTGLTAASTDARLVNPWGLSRSTTSPWWVSDNGAGLSTLYNGAGATQGLFVKIPGPNGSDSNTFVATPTGTVYNGNPNAFLIGGKPASFIFVTEDGTISGWTGGAAGSSATLVIDNSTNPTPSEGAVYKGAAIGEFNGNEYLYVANFRSGKIEVYDASFKLVHLSDHDRDDRWDDRWDRDDKAFDDDRIPRGFAPFNIQNIGGDLFVTYARQDRQKHDDLAGTGNGFVDLFSPSGRLLTRFQHGPWLNSPWGIVWAPRDFGEFSNKILVGNFGSGWIAAYDGFTGQFEDFMRDHNGNILKIDGLWALAFGNSAQGCPSTQVTGLPKCGAAGPYNSLFFSAGPNDEADGLFGTLTPDPAFNELNEGDEL